MNKQGNQEYWNRLLLTELPIPKEEITFAIKGCMALIAFFGFKYLHRKTGDMPSRIISGIVAELMMILGYFVFEGFMYGFGPSAVNIPANGVQGIAGLIIGIVLTKVFIKSKIHFD